ncbi:MAG: hypothetical protein ACREQR_12195 [Candidatus Binataceae bacterium]
MDAHYGVDRWSGKLTLRGGFLRGDLVCGGEAASLNGRIFQSPFEPNRWFFSGEWKEGGTVYFFWADLEAKPQ